MNEPTDNRDDASGWDSLASELGLDPAPTAAPKPPPVAVTSAPKPQPAAPPPAPMAPPAAKKHQPEPETDADPFGGFAEVVPTRVVEVEMEITSVADAVVDSDDNEVAMEESSEAVESGPEGEEGAGEETAEGAPAGRRRRRRRRRKGGKPDAPVVAGEAPAESPEAEAVVAVVERDDVDEPAQIIGEAAGELEDDDDENDAQLPAAEQELEDDSTEPLPEWKVVAWTDLIATLYRPQDR